MFFKLPDGSVHDENGRLLYFSTERFLREICEGEACFICGARPGAVTFNREHILPNWILRRYRLASKKIDLSNLKGHLYSSYTVPCCAQCNSDMDRIFEKPISKLTTTGYDAMVEYLRSGAGYLHLFTWLSLIFLKVHLKDKELPSSLDKRVEGGKLGDSYYWEDFHHLHCIARSFYTHSEVDYRALGSLLVVPAAKQANVIPFDFCDLTAAQTLLLRLGDVAFIVVLNDSGAALQIFANLLNGLPDCLTAMQLRELMAHFATVNLSLLKRPGFVSQFKPREERYVISASRPERLETKATLRSQFGKIFRRLLHEWLSGLPEGHAIEQAVREGKYTFFSPPLNL